jgi:O-antigen/teichoic acid export membrane protein
MKTLVISGAILVGLFFFAVAALYFLIPAGSLPAFVPGYDPGSAKLHVTHGLGMLVIGLVAFALAWFRSWGD